MREVGDNAASLSERLGWGTSYVANLLNGQFRPSRERCIALAEVFQDDPNIILALADYYRPPREDPLIQEVTTMLNSLPDEALLKVREYVLFLKHLQDAGRPN